MPRVWTIRIYSARWSRKGVLPGKGGPLATDRFLRPFLPKKTDISFLTFWGGDVAQKQRFQKTNQIEDILCLNSKRSLLRLFGILVCCIFSADAIWAKGSGDSGRQWHVATGGRWRQCQILAGGSIGRYWQVEAFCKQKVCKRQDVAGSFRWVVAGSER